MKKLQSELETRLYGYTGFYCLGFSAVGFIFFVQFLRDLRAKHARHGHRETWWPQQCGLPSGCWMRSLCHLRAASDWLHVVRHGKLLAHPEWLRARPRSGTSAASAPHSLPRLAFAYFSSTSPKFTKRRCPRHTLLSARPNF